MVDLISESDQELDRLGIHQQISQAKKLNMQKLPSLFASLALILSFSVFSSWAISSNSYLVNYWNTHVYKGALPEFLLSRASPLTTAESVTFAQLANRNALSSHIDSFCASANLLCSTGSASSQAELLDELIGTEKLSLRSSKNDNSLASDKHGEVKVEPGLFFRAKDIKTGNVVPMPDYIDKLPKRSFLPRTVASKLPFSSSKLPEIRKIFHATEHSTLDTILKHSMRMCEQAPIAALQPFATWMPLNLVRIPKCSLHLGLLQVKLKFAIS
ncbi:hypothetical protein Droror1_Dr00018585 [Drosera rotundifolia]